MHYSVLAIVPHDEPLDKAVEEAMGNPGDWWDWYQIGGRWTGLFDDYEPEKDPRNQEVCSLCRGTGTRFWPEDTAQEWIDECKGCNGCKGTGKATKWPTAWAKHPGDIIPVRQLTQEQLDKFHDVVVLGYGHFGGQRFLPWNEDGKAFVDNESPPLAWLQGTFGDYLAVVVDCHN